MYTHVLCSRATTNTVLGSLPHTLRLWLCHSCQAAACVLPAGMVLAKPRLGPPSLHCCACKRMVTLTLGVRLSV